MYALARSYAIGEGVGRDDNIAETWLRRAAEAGHERAKTIVASLPAKAAPNVPDFTSDFTLERRAPTVERSMPGSVALPEGIAAATDTHLRDVDPPTDPAAAAIQLYKRAAEAGDVGAMQDLASRYERGAGVAADPAAAYSWRLRAAEAGSASAMNNVGYDLTNGVGIAANPEEGLKWYRKSADAGNATAMVNVGLAYSNGVGVRSDFKQAYEWFRKAAEAGDVRGMAELGKCLRQGMGVETDMIEAMSWFGKAMDFTSRESASSEIWKRQFRFTSKPRSSVRPSR
jgi:TPR repeat protein